MVVARSCLEKAKSGRESLRTCPRLGVRVPRRIRRSVDLPAPLGPRMAVRVEAGKWAERLRRTGRCGKEKSRDWAERAMGNGRERRHWALGIGDWWVDGL